MRLGLNRQGLSLRKEVTLWKEREGKDVLFFPSSPFLGFYQPFKVFTGELKRHSQSRRVHIWQIRAQHLDTFGVLPLFLKKCQLTVSPNQTKKNERDTLARNGKNLNERTSDHCSPFPLQNEGILKSYYEKEIIKAPSQHLYLDLCFYTKGVAPFRSAWPSESYVATPLGLAVTLIPTCCINSCQVTLWYALEEMHMLQCFYRLSRTILANRWSHCAMCCHQARWSSGIGINLCFFSSRKHVCIILPSSFGNRGRKFGLHDTC